VIYSCGWLDPEAKRRLAALVEDRFFDLSVLQLSAEEPDELGKLLAFLRPLRAAGERKDQTKIN
jgi:hypothetical protein